jgi:hypothetical protein
MLDAGGKSKSLCGARTASRTDRLTHEPVGHFVKKRMPMMMASNSRQGSRSHMMQTPQELWNELVDARMALEDALQEGKMLSLQDMAPFLARAIAANNAIVAAESR